MSGFSEFQAVSQGLVYNHFGYDAAWAGVDGTVRVLLDEPDADQAFGRSRAVLATTVIKVRVGQVAGPPLQGDLVTVAASDGRPEQTYRLTADGRFAVGDTRRTEWLCEAEPV